MKGEQGHEKEQAVTSSGDHELLFHGCRTFWRCGARLDVTIVEHLTCDVLELVAYDPPRAFEAPRILVNTSMVTESITSSDRFATRMAEEKEKLLRQHVGEPDMERVAKTLLREMKVDYLLSRLAVQAMGDKSAAESSQEHWRVELQPCFSDVVDPLTGRMQAQLSSLPEEAVGFIVPRSKYNDPLNFDSTLKQFQNLANQVDYYPTLQPVRRASLTPLTESALRNKRSNLMQPTVSSASRQLPQHSPNTRKSLVASEAPASPASSAVATAAAAAVAAVESSPGAGIATPSRDTDNDSPVAGSSPVPLLPLSALQASSETGSEVQPAAPRTLKRLNSQDDILMMEPTSSHVMPKAISRKKSFTDDDVTGNGGNISRLRNALLQAKNAEASRSFKEKSSASRPSPLLRHVATCASGIDRMMLDSMDSARSTDKKPPLVRSATATSLGSPSTPAAASSTTSSTTQLPPMSARKPRVQNWTDRSPSSSNAGSRCASPALPSPFTRSGSGLKSVGSSRSLASIGYSSSGCSSPLSNTNSPRTAPIFPRSFSKSNLDSPINSKSGKIVRVDSGIFPTASTDTNVLADEEPFLPPCGLQV